MISEKKYVCSCLITVCIAISVVAGFNYWQDPAEIFAEEGRYQEAAELLAKGENIAITSNYDERLFKKSVIKVDGGNKKVVIMGSSRIMGLGNDAFVDNLDVLNLAVSGAVLQDDIALWHIMMEKADRNVKTVIIGLDPWLLNKRNGDKRWISIDEDYEKALQDWGEKTSKAYRYDGVTQLLSIKYTKESLKNWRKKQQSLQVWEEKEPLPPGWSIIHPDGSRIWSQKDNNLDVEKEAKKYVANKVYQLEDFEELDTDLQHKFSMLIQDMQKRGLEVVFYLPPYHPYVYDYLCNNPRYESVLAAQNYFVEFAHRHNIVLLGSYNPKDMHMKELDFIDGMHLRRDSLVRWWKATQLY
ncbi:MAG: hypothetical protein E7203_05505 [Selenomonas ruminantium]|jgi:hypothetical protein|uniref:Uncharacterized protein n=1 Tax=Selenomonas ruminantium TaxID=971 RepID=A0A927ZYU3_SELRU|nr:hypothetical protein [Selenomonas ruminantium]MBE6084913.1 hypothetical protein [Selenomonas ruminantium]